MSNDINSRVLANAEPFFAWDVVTYLFALLVLAFVIVVLDLVFFASKESTPESQNQNQSKFGKFFYFLFFLKFSKNEKHDHRPKVVQWSIEFFPILILVILFRGFVFEPFRVPSGSMTPTMLTGDFIVVNKFSYGLKLPITNTELVKFSEPERGDVVVFRYPNYDREPAYENTDFIKRIVGLPGDSISYVDDQLTINGDIASINRIGNYDWTEWGQKTGFLGLVSGSTVPRKGKTRGQEAVIHVASTGNNSIIESIEHKEWMLSSESFDNSQHLILTTKDYSPAREEVVVPDDHYFVMGDNRNASGDSRKWGFVPEDYIIGEAVGIWMHLNFNNFDVKLDRIGGFD